MYTIIHYLDANGKDVYQDWLDSLRDQRAKGVITAKVARLGAGLFGNQRPLREGIHELRIDLGPGYRVYFAFAGDKLILLVCGGSKNSQDADIQLAIRHLRNWKKYHANDLSGP